MTHRKEEAPAAVTAQGTGIPKLNGSDSDPQQMSAQALKVIEGQQKADAYMARLQAQQADPDELALIVSMLYGAALRGFCRALEKAVRHE
jgi:hypothetical protein